MTGVSQCVRLANIEDLLKIALGGEFTKKKYFMDIKDARLNWPRDRFSKNISMPKRYDILQTIIK